jgi:hypothetical protein
MMFVYIVEQTAPYESWWLEGVFPDEESARSFIKGKAPGYYRIGKWRPTKTGGLIKTIYETA